MNFYMHLTILNSFLKKHLHEEEGQTSTNTVAVQSGAICKMLQTA